MRDFSIVEMQELTLKTNKLRIYKATVLCVLLYGSDIWQMKLVDGKKLDAFWTPPMFKEDFESHVERVTN